MFERRGGAETHGVVLSSAELSSAEMFSVGS